MACETKFLDLVSAVYDTPDRVRELDCSSKIFKDVVYMGSFLKLGVPFRVLLIRVLHYFGDLKGHPNLENYPHELVAR